MRVLVPSALFLGFALPSSALAQGDILEGLWEISMRMEVGGQPASATPLVVRHCINEQTAQELMSQLTGGGGAGGANFRTFSRRAPGHAGT